MTIARSLPLLILASLAGTARGAAKVEVGPDVVLNVGYFLQAQAQAVEDAAPSGDDWSKDLFVRRSRIMLFGTLAKNISFFMDTDQVNLGKGGAWSAPFFVQDAFMTFKVDEEFMLDAGMILLPLSRFNFQGAVGLHGLDYHLPSLKFPEGSTLVMRDAGVQARGYLFCSEKLHYRAGVFGGSQNVVLQRDADDAPVARSNPEDLPRVTGHLRYAVLGKEKDFFPKGIYFTKAPIVSFGVGADLQPDAALRRPAELDPVTGDVTRPAELGSHLAVAADVYVDVPVARDGEAVFQGGLFYYDDGDDVKTSGLAVAAEAGYRFRALEPVLGLDYFRSEADASDQLVLSGGLNWWIRQHASNVKAAVSAERKGDLGAASWVPAVTVQAQLLF